jgi:hypothetical protein
VWNANTEDPRALLVDSGASRIAACWVDYDPITFDLDVLDGFRHQVSLYFLDWDSMVRQDRIEVLSASNTNLVLDSRNLSDFHNGRYMSWFVAGHVLIRITRLQSNVTISGLFFDALPSAPMVVQPLWLTPIPNGQISILSWTALKGLTYRVEFTTNLNSPVWSAVPGDTMADGGTARTWHQVAGKPRQMFYRVVALP